MIIAVFAKQIPSPEAVPALDPTTKTLDRPGPLVLDDSDAVGVEMALQLADQLSDSEVVLVSMAPDQENSGLRTGLAMGANRAVLVSDPALAGSDALATAKVLAAVVGRIGADLVIAATESTDGYTGTMPVQVAELLGFPAASFAKMVQFDGAVLRVERQTESGYDDVECVLPAVVTVTAAAVEPRYPSMKGIIQARSKTIETLALTELGIDPSTVGSARSRQEILSVEAGATREQGRIIVDDGTAHEEIIALLVDAKVI